MKSNLTKQQQQLVRSPEFKKWFGDWENSPLTASKVVDENGEPLVVYHGTNKDFYIFCDKHKGTNTTDENTKFGYFFSKYIDEAKVYMREAIWKDTPEKYNELFGARIIECFLNIKNPLIVGYAESNNIEKIESRMTENNDGISDERGDFICFNSNQIKLADGSNTKFDGNSNDIRFSGGGAITSKGIFKSLGSAKELGITPKIEGHDMIAKCDCGEKFSYQNSKKNIVWECPECKGMKRLKTS